MFVSRDSRLVRIVLIAFFALLLGYALFEARGILRGPVITLPSDTLLVDEPTTVIRGTSERITELRLNGKQIPVTEAGAFEERFILAEGSNYFVLEALDARGRTTQETLTIVYVPREASRPLESATSTP